MNTNITRNQLSAAELFKLTRWVESNTAVLDGLKQDDIAGKASSALGLRVTVANIAGVFHTLAAVGVKTPAPFRRPPPPGSLINSAKHVFVARALRELMVSLGHPVPHYLMLVCNNSATDEITEAYDRHIADKRIA